MRKTRCVDVHRHRLDQYVFYNNYLNATKSCFILTLDRSKYLDYYVFVQPSIESL